MMVAALAAAGMLAACGGGGDDKPATGQNGGGQGSANQSPGNQTPGGSTNAAAFEAPFAAGDEARQLSMSGWSKSLGLLTAIVQNANGIVTTLNDATLTGQIAAADVSGNANYALGRWTSGTLNQNVVGPTSKTLTGTAAGSFHYVAYKLLKALPGSGTLHCAVGAATAATAFTGSSEATGSVSGSGTLDFSGDGAKVDFDIAVSIGTETIKGVVSGLIKSPSATLTNGNFLSSGSGSYVALADNGGGTVRIIVGHQEQTTNGLYGGIATYVCK
jgi:hypothetical protein